MRAMSLQPSLPLRGAGDSPASIRRRRAAGILAAAAMTTALLGMAVQARADTATAVAVRAGTTGVGVDFDLGINRQLNVRIGYSGFDYNRSISSSDADYEAHLKLGLWNGLIDWYPVGQFHLTAGAVYNATHVDATAEPAAGGSYIINGTAYPGSEVSPPHGRLTFGNTVDPYLGLGWGNPVGSTHRLHLLFDAGVIYGGTPNVVLQANCAAAIPPGSAGCAQLQRDVQTERQRLQNDVTFMKWYPVVTLGLAYRL